MSDAEKQAMRAIISAQVALWDTERTYEAVIDREIDDFSAVRELAVCAEDVTDEDLEIAAEEIKQ